MFQPYLSSSKKYFHYNLHLMKYPVKTYLQTRRRNVFQFIQQFWRRKFEVNYFN